MLEEGMVLRFGVLPFGVFLLLFQPGKASSLVLLLLVLRVRGEKGNRNQGRWSKSKDKEK